jgi:Xaa-Pro aminopeptidase
MELDGYTAAPFAERRAKLARALGDQPALVASGVARPRNYAANIYPFRAQSHFLYLFGLPLRGAFGLYEGGRWSLYAPPPDRDAALWHGPEPTLDELGERMGLPVRPLGELPSVLAGKSAATLPASDLETCETQASLVDRPVRPGALAAIDEPLADALIELRLRHDPAAIAQLRKAAQATAAAHAAGMAATRPGQRESVVRAAMEASLIARGMTVAYGSIVTVHGEVLHSETHHRVCRAGDLLLADVGAETTEGWAGDVTRTWPVSGTYSPTQRAMYEVVLRAQQATIAAVRPGVRYRDLHRLAGRTLAEGLVGLGILRGDPAELEADGVVYQLFPHGIGHLLGLDVHDMEDLGDRAGYLRGRTRPGEFGVRYLRLDRDLSPGMAITIEPGIYLVPGILQDPELSARAGDRIDRAALARFQDVRGIRIEDDVLVTEGGSEILTAVIPKHPAAVEAAVRG